MLNKSITFAALGLTLAVTFGCSEAPKSELPAAESVQKIVDQAKSPQKAIVTVNKAKLEYAVHARSDEDKSRDDARNPIKTLEFFQVAPGMVVAEALPGGGWYSKILARYLGSEGTLYGINYNDDMWARFGFFDEESIQKSIEQTAKFPEMVSGFAEQGPQSSGFTFNSAPKELAGTVDRVLFIRALHNLSRFENEADTMSGALLAAHMMLKENGLVGVVQHQGPEKNSDDWAKGGSGYLKKSAVIEAFKTAGFELVAESDINENRKDVPTEEEIVWRLPPSYSGTADDPLLKSKVDAIGESNRMTLLFKKAE
jgi:predicted methyltransferase